MIHFYFSYVKFYLELCLYLSFVLFGSLKKNEKNFFSECKYANRVPRFA